MARFFMFFFFALLAVAHALPLVERRSSSDVVENVYGRDLIDRGDLALTARQYEELASIADRDLDNNLEKREPLGVISAIKVGIKGFVKGIRAIVKKAKEIKEKAKETKAVQLAAKLAKKVVNNLTGNNNSSQNRRRDFDDEMYEREFDDLSRARIL